MLDRFEIAARLREIGELLRLTGEKSYRARAYEQGAEALESMSEALDVLIAEKRLTSLHGIGKALAAQVTELFQTGRSATLERLRQEVPTGARELAQVRGVGLKKAVLLARELGVASVADLKAACEAKRVQAVPGLGPATERKILEAIRAHETRAEQVLLLDALEVGEHILAYLRACPSVERAELAGAVRRFSEVVTDLVLVVSSIEYDRVLEHMRHFPEVAQVTQKAPDHMTVRLASGLPVELHVTAPDHFFHALFWWTGTPPHREKVRRLAEAKHLQLDEFTMVRQNGEERPPIVRSEADLYQKVGLPWIPPELREDGGEIEEAQTGATWDDLICVGEIRGMTHCHTTYSDGRNSIDQMAHAAEAMGMTYLTITDHSPAAAYAGGVTLDRLKRQWDEIASVQERVSIRLLRGTESDILEDGALDYPDAILERLDIVIASVHVRHQMDADQMTRRLVRAMRHPLFKIWGHALGRLLLRREPFACHLETVLDAIAESRAAIEVNGDPHRLDLEPRWLREARRRNIRFIISTDAHSTRDFENLRFGVGIARRGGLRRQDVLNALPVGDFRDAVCPLAGQ